MPNYMFNAYGASLDWIARDRPLLRDTVAAMIEANRTIYRDKDKVVPIIVEATKKPKDAVEYAWDVETKNCVWSVNGGFDPKRTQWTIDNSVENGDIEKDKKPTVEQVANIALAKRGGRKRRRPRDHRQLQGLACPVSRAQRSTSALARIDALQTRDPARSRISDAPLALRARAHRIRDTV